MFVVVVVSWKNERRFTVRAPKGRQVGVIFGREVRQRLRITFSLKSPQDPGVTPVRIQEGRKTAHLPHRYRRHTHTHTHTPLWVSCSCYSSSDYLLPQEAESHPDTRLELHLTRFPW